jgi:DNA transformation protein and related proteins
MLTIASFAWPGRYRSGTFSRFCNSGSTSYDPEPRMPVTPGFTDYVVEQLDGCGPISTKRMFGGVGLYSGDTFFALIDNDVLYLKVDDSTRPDFDREGCGPFRPYGDDRETMGYYNVPVEVLEDADALCAWGRKAIAVANAAKGRKKKR